MSLRYERPERTRAFAQEGMGLVDYGVSIQNLPGTCTWNPWGFPDIPPEPGVVHFDLPRDAQAWLSPGNKDTTITAAAGDEAIDSSRQVVTVPGSRDAPGSAGTTRLSDARHDRRVQLRSGIRNVTVLPGPHGVRLAFELEDRGRVRVQFSREAPPWDDREGLWAYPAGLDSPWYAKLEWRRGGRGYEAVPRYDLKPGVRYYYLITADGTEASPPTRQRVGCFTATVGP
jgi:hypothetical protein